MTLLRDLQEYVGSGQTGGTETTYETIVLVQAWKYWGTGKKCIWQRFRKIHLDITTN